MKLLSYSYLRLIMLNFFDRNTYKSIDDVVASKESVQCSYPTPGEKETNFMSLIGLTVLATSFAYATRQRGKERVD